MLIYTDGSANGITIAREQKEQSKSTTYYVGWRLFRRKYRTWCQWDTLKGALAFIESEKFRYPNRSYYLQSTNYGE